MHIPSIHQCRVIILTLMLPAGNVLATPLGLADMFNAYSRNDFIYKTTDIEGVIGAGGNVTYTGGDVGRHAALGNPYSIYAGGNATISSHYVKNGGIEAGGNIVTQNTTLGGNVNSQGTTTIKAGSFDKPTTITSQGSISVNNNAIKGKAFTGGNFTGTSGGFTGDITASGSIIQNGYGINGTKTSGAQAPSVSILNHQAVADAIVDASQNYASVTANRTVVETNVNPAVNEWLFAGNSGLNVFNIDGGILNSFNSMFFTGPADATYIINVSGLDIDILHPGGFHYSGGASNSMVLFNMFEATTLDIHGSFWGTILAPNAFVTTYGDGTLFGSLYADNITGSSQINSVYFKGEEPPIRPAAAQVPAPATLPLLLAGLIALVWHQRRKTS